MKYLKRFDPIHTAGGMAENRDGAFVKFEDYLKERQSLAHSRDHLTGIVEEIAKLVGRNQKKETLIGAVRRVMK